MPNWVKAKKAKGISEEAIRHARNKERHTMYYRNGVVPTNKKVKWEHCEDEKVLSHAITDRSLSFELKRTIPAIQSRRKILKNTGEFYSAYDLQTGRYMASGRNSKSKQECIVALADYLNSEPHEARDTIPATEEDVCSFEFEIQKHEGKIPDESWG